MTVCGRPRDSKGGGGEGLPENPEYAAEVLAGDANRETVGRIFEVTRDGAQLWGCPGRCSACRRQGILPRDRAANWQLLWHGPAGTSDAAVKTAVETGCKADRRGSG